MAEFARVFKIQGMDSDASPRFQMVPAGFVKKRFVILRDGVGMTLSVADPSVCNFTEILESALPKGNRATRKTGDRFFRLEGGSTSATTTLTATGGASPAPVVLDIGVKNKRQLLVVFNFVRDNAGHTTSRPAANVAQFMPTLKLIWETQANVDVVQQGGIKKVRVARNMGRTVLLPAGPLVLGTAGSDDAAIAATGSTGDLLNVFFVNEVQQSGNPVDIDAVTKIGMAGTGQSGVCLFEDNAGRDQAFSLAHEIGHHLGLLDRATPAKDLMHGITGQRGINLSKADVNAVNNV
jgi:hypothetical protein